MILRHTALAALCCATAVVRGADALAGRPKRSLALRRRGVALRWAPLVRRRGGSLEDDDEDDDDDDDFDEDDEDDDDFDESIFDDEVSQEDFDGDTFKARTLKAWATTPPMTQAYVGASLGLTAFSFMACNNQWPEMLHLNWGAVLKRAQLWRTGGVPSFFFRRLFGYEDICLPPQSETGHRTVHVDCVFLSFNI